MFIIIEFCEVTFVNEISQKNNNLWTVGRDCPAEAFAQVSIAVPPSYGTQRKGRLVHDPLNLRVCNEQDPQAVCRPLQVRPATVGGVVGYQLVVENSAD